MAISVLFVCLGNICRSPLAEGALRQKCSEAGIPMIIDSAGTADWHEGRPPDDRAIAVAEKNGAAIDHLRARQVQANDFHDFDYIFALDEQNLSDLREKMPDNAPAKLSLLFDYVDGQEGQGVADPYYGADEAFDQTWREVTLAAAALCQELGQ